MNLPLLKQVDVLISQFLNSAKHILTDSCIVLRLSGKEIKTEFHNYMAIITTDHIAMPAVLF